MTWDYLKAGIIIIIAIHISSCVSTKEYFKLVEGSKDGEISNYPTNVYEVRISNTVSAYLWLYGGFAEKASFTAVINIPEKVTVQLLGNTININSDDQTQTLKIMGISNKSDSVALPDSQITGNSREQFTFFGYKSIPSEHLVILEDNTFEVNTNTFSIQLPDMLINNVNIKPPAYHFIKDKGLRLISLN
jgi:hypothetical protein